MVIQLAILVVLNIGRSVTNMNDQHWSFSYQYWSFIILVVQLPILVVLNIGRSWPILVIFFARDMFFCWWGDSGSSGRIGFLDPRRRRSTYGGGARPTVAALHRASLTQGDSTRPLGSGARRWFLDPRRRRSTYGGSASACFLNPRRQHVTHGGGARPTVALDGA